MKYLFLFVIACIIGFFSVFVYDRWRTSETIQKAKQVVQVSAKKTTFSVANAPSSSLKARITAMTGEVLWESRTASESSLLLEPRSLQQGESVETGDNATVTLLFPNISTINMAQDTSLSLIQTLPQSILLEQSQGLATYTGMTDKPFSVRSLHLLSVQKNGKMTVSVDQESGSILVSVVRGSVSLAFNDLDNIASKITITDGQSYEFDDATRTGQIVE